MILLTSTVFQASPRTLREGHSIQLFSRFRITPPEDIIAESTGEYTPLAIGTATTNCLSATISNDAPDAFRLGATTVLWTATDSNGDWTTSKQIITVRDTTPPALIVPSDIDVTITGPLTQVDIGTATATDLFLKEIINNAPIAFQPGTTEVLWRAVDTSGNEMTGIQKITVHYAFAGFLQPVDNAPAVNTAKAGSAIPVKFSLDGNHGLNIFFEGYPKSKSVDGFSSSLIDEIETTITAGSSVLTYDPLTDTYTYVWKTDKAWAGQNRQLIIKFIDGKEYYANFFLKK